MFTTAQDTRKTDKVMLLLHVPVASLVRRALGGRAGSARLCKKKGLSGSAHLACAQVVYEHFPIGGRSVVLVPDRDGQRLADERRDSDP